LAKSTKKDAGIALRQVDSSDAMLLFDWLNQPDRIASSLQTGEPVSLERHLDWFSARLADPSCMIWLLDTADGPAGQLRLQNSQSAAEVSIYVAPAFRGRGIAVAALAAAAAYCRDTYSHGRLLARVRQDNAASARLFLVAGFVVIEEFADHSLFALDTRTGPHETDTV
jgi:RimJ/RimL family protein N-acetyltransferase